MTEAFVLQALGKFLSQYNVGQALFLLFILSVLAVLPLKSRKAFSLNVTAFGLVFTLTPTSVAPFHYRLLGIVLLVVGPVLYTTSR